MHVFFSDEGSWRAGGVTSTWRGGGVTSTIGADGALQASLARRERHTRRRCAGGVTRSRPRHPGPMAPAQGRRPSGPGPEPAQRPRPRKGAVPGAPTKKLRPKGLGAGNPAEEGLSQGPRGPAQRFLTMLKICMHFAKFP